MGQLTFYRQARADGGIRTGLDTSENAIALSFEPRTSADDPRLDWYIDIRCEGRKVPEYYPKCREWLRKQSRIIQPELLALADELELGIDPNSWPGQQDVKRPPAGAKIRIVYLASRRIPARQMGTKLRDFGDRFLEYLDRLKPVKGVAAE